MFRALSLLFNVAFSDTAQRSTFNAYCPMQLVVVSVVVSAVSTVTTM